MTVEPTKGERTRKRLIEATAALLRRQGYHATGLSEIVAESGAPRGSLYFYFPGGKDELAITALRASGDQWRARIDRVIAGATDLAAAFDAVAVALADELEATGWDNGCPVAAVALEATSAPLRAAITEHFQRWLDLVVGFVAPFGIREEPARELALIALSSLEGALLLARVMRSRDPLLAVGRSLRAMAELALPAAASTTPRWRPVPR